MPAYNASQYIGAAIESVISQTYTTWELIVVDDGSTDDTAAVVKAFGDRVRYFYQPNARQAAARNNGLRHAMGELIAFLDADDVWLPQKLEKQVDLWKRSPGLGLVYSSLQEIDSADRPIRQCRANLRGRNVLEEVLLGSFSTVGAGSTGLVPRKVMEAVGDFDADLSPCEDTDLLWRIAARYPIDYVDDALVLYRMHGGNSHRNLARTTLAWKGLYRKALRDPDVRLLGLRFRFRCRGRLYYMLVGDHARGRHWWTAILYSIQCVFWWPPTFLKIIGRIFWRGRTV